MKEKYVSPTEKCTKTLENAACKRYRQMAENVINGQIMREKRQNYLLIFLKNLLYTGISETGLEKVKGAMAAPGVHILQWIGRVPVQSSLSRAEALLKINRSRELQN